MDISSFRSFAKHYQAITNAQLEVPMDLFGFRALVEPIFEFMTGLENRRALL
jgi:hypothetical protein